jgi:hypothetical protein
MEVVVVLVEEILEGFQVLVVLVEVVMVEMVPMVLRELPILEEEVAVEDIEILLLLLIVVAMALLEL